MTQKEDQAINQDALHFHIGERPGKIEVISTKPLTNQRDLSLAYSPGVAAPCLEIYKNPKYAYTYTSKGNLVAVMSNGSAVLGLGDLGALASKPVMEGKAVLFKRFADIDAIDLEVDTNDIETFIQCARCVAPSFGGINLEDIKAPDCFIIEKKLVETLRIPVFHDDQHGTAVIACAGLINAADISGRSFDDHETGHQRRRGFRHRLRRFVSLVGGQVDYHVRYQGRPLSRTKRRHEPVETTARHRNLRQNPRRSYGSSRCFRRVVDQGRGLS